MATTNESNGFYKLSWLQRIGFGSGDLAQNLIFQTVATYLMIYLTTVLKINLAFVSGLILTRPTHRLFLIHTHGLRQHRSDSCSVRFPHRSGHVYSFCHRLESGHLHGHWHHSLLHYPAVYAGIEEMAGQKGSVLYPSLYLSDWIGTILFIIGKFFDVASANALVQTAKVMTGVGLLVGSLMWALVPEVITEAEYRTGNRPAATVNALAGVAFKAGFSIAGWITPLVMGWIGFNFVSEESALPTDPMAWFTVTAVFALVGFVLLMLCFMGSKENITTTPEKPVSYGEMWQEFKANKCLQLVLAIFVVVFLASFISAPVNAYYVKLANYSDIAQNAILMFTTVIPAILLLLVGYLIYKYPLTDEKLDEMSREIEARNKQ